MLYKYREPTTKDTGGHKLRSARKSDVNNESIFIFLKNGHAVIIDSAGPPEPGRLGRLWPLHFLRVHLTITYLLLITLK